MSQYGANQAKGNHRHNNQRLEIRFQRHSKQCINTGQHKKDGDPKLTYGGALILRTTV